jgi:hypothetical protein
MAERRQEFGTYRGDEGSVGLAFSERKEVQWGGVEGTLGGTTIGMGRGKNLTVNHSACE